MTRTVAQKMGLEAGMRSLLIAPPDQFLHEISAPELEILEQLRGQFEYIHLFVRSQREMEQQFSLLKPQLALRGFLWLSWPKSGQLGADLNLRHVIRIGYAAGLVESTCLSIDPTWSALKFTHPKPGKVYQNSYGELNLD